MMFLNLLWPAMGPASILLLGCGRGDTGRVALPQFLPVIASAAKQSSAAPVVRLDCFVATLLAMTALVQPQCGLVGLEQRVGLLAVVGLHLAEADDGADRLGVVAARLGLAVDVLDVVRDRLLLLLQALDALDEQPQFVSRDRAFRHLILLP